MPLLGLFSKKSKSPLKSSFGVSSTSNVSLQENGWVDINTVVASPSTNQQQQPRQRQPPSIPSSPFNKPAHISNNDCVYEPPARHSSLFPPIQGDKNSVDGSVQSHNGPVTRSAPNKPSSIPSHLPPPLPSKKSLFNWYSSPKERSHTTTVPSTKSASESSDASFNLKSFRHVRPESPSFSSTTPATFSSAAPLPQPPSASPALVPVPTSALPPAPVSFQVTSRRPRPTPSPLLSFDTPPTSSYSANRSTSPTSAALPSQSRMAAGVFRQAARRSATSLSLGDPIVVPGGGTEGQGSGVLTLSLSSDDDFKEMASFLSSPPKLPPFSFSFSNPDFSSNSTDAVSINSTRPPRPRPPPSLATNQASSSSAPYTLLNHSSTSVPTSALASNSSPLLPASPSSSISKPVSTKHSSSSQPSSVPPGKRNNNSNNAFGSSSSDVSDSEEEESESESDGRDTGLPRVSRKRTVRPRYNTSNTTPTITTAPVTPGRARAATTTAAPSRPSPIGVEASNSQLNLPSSISPQPVSNSLRSVPTDSNNTSLGRSVLAPSNASHTAPVPRPPSTFSVYSNGTRPRASASVGALDPSAKEARASAVLVNSRLSTATNLSTPKAMNKSLNRNTGSDTSESESEADSDEEDAPLSKLIPPKRPGTSMSSHSAASNSSLHNKPLIDLSAPSTFSGRPVGAPAPISREEEEMPRPRILVDTKGRSSPILKNTNSNPISASGKIASPSQSPHLSQQQQPGKKPPQSSLSLSSGSTMSSPSSSGASLTTSSRGVGGASSDTSISPSDRNLRYRSFANGGIDSVSDNNSGSRSAGSGLSPSRISQANSPSLNLPSVAVPPMRPFVRRESPTASSTGDSSSGKVPLTPKEENDTPRTIRPPSALVSSKNHPRPTHGRKSSVTFEDDVSFMDNGTKSVKTAEDDLAVGEAKRRERRRTEARAAIELGKVVNGPPPIDEDEMALNAGTQAAWPQFGMQMPMQPMPMPMSMPMQSMFGMGGNMGGMAMNPQMQMAFQNPMPPMPSNDPAFLMAHQQAMAIAKQTFQYAVAQQALAAANEEWERNSTMTGYMPVGNYMNMNMRGSMAFPPAMASMYAGSTGGGSLINGFNGLGGAGAAGGGWGGTRSVYGGSFGPATATPMGMRLSTYSSTDLTAMNPPMIATVNASGSRQTGQPQQRPGVRQRTKTAPSSQTSPVHPQACPPPIPSPAKSAVRTRAPAPPSSFRGVHG